MNAEVPPGFEEGPRRSPFIEAMGPFYTKREMSGGQVVGFRVHEKHINTRGFLHGGVICSLADIAMGYNIAFAQEPPLPMVTANLAVDFAGTARLGDWVECRVDVQRVGGRLAFANAYVWCGEERIARASAIFSRADAPKE